MSGTKITPSAIGDYTNKGMPLGGVHGVTQTVGTPTDVKYISLDLTSLTASQVAGIENGTLTVKLSFDEVGRGKGTHMVKLTGGGLTDAGETTLSSGHAGVGGYNLITKDHTIASLLVGPGGGTLDTVNVTHSVAAALTKGDTFFVVGAYETTGGKANILHAALEITCYAGGTQMRTPRGDVPVERLQIGEQVLTGVDGIAQPIIWIGERTINLRAHPRPELAAPIRILAGAFADGVPARDLLVSPDHGMFEAGRLVPARQLVNGTTITQLLDLPSVQYFHVELAQHALLLAEGLLAESYLDTGNRAIFANAGAALMLHPEFSVNAGLRSWRSDACAQLANAEEAMTAWQRLTVRAEALGHGAAALPATTLESLPRLTVGGRTLSPVLDNERLVFALPAGAAGTVRLTSRATAPAALRPWEDDRRDLGVCVRALLLHGADGVRRIAVDDPALGDGWWAAEPAAGGPQRWTNGDAAITLPAAEDARVLEVVLVGPALHAESAPVRRAA